MEVPEALGVSGQPKFPVRLCYKQCQRRAFSYEGRLLPNLTSAGWGWWCPEKTVIGWLDMLEGGIFMPS